MRNRLTVTAAVLAVTAALAACSTGDDDEAAVASATQSALPTSFTSGPASAGSPTSATTAPPEGQVDCTYSQSARKAPNRDVTPPPAAQPDSGTTAVTFTINGGAVPMTFDHASAPCTVAAVTSLIEQGYYDDTPCHRVTVPQGPEGLAVLQCGDPTGTGTGGPGFTIDDEPPSGLEPASSAGAALYPRGTVAMAKTARRDSAGSQFFLVYEDSALPPDYAVLGTIDESGMAVLDGITAAGAKSDDPSDPDSQVPRDEVRISEAAVTG